MEVPEFYAAMSPIVIDNMCVAHLGGQDSEQLNWENSNYGVSFNSPVLKDGYLYGNGARLGKLFCLDASTGETAWADTTAHNRFAALLDLGSVMVTLPATGNLIFFEPNPEEYSEIKVYKVSETEVYAHPVFAGNKIYIKDEEMLTCYSLGN